MAFWGRLIPKHTVCRHSMRLPLASRSAQTSLRTLSNLAADQDGLVQEASLMQEGRVSENEPKTFEELFKKSTFVALGNPKGKIVVGTIKKVVERSVYIDFGWKFPCVCTVPQKGSGSYMPGRKVRILIRELELASKFLGSHTELSLNEANCVLLGLLSNNSVSNEAQDVSLLSDATEEEFSSPFEKRGPINIAWALSGEANQKSPQETSDQNETKPYSIDSKKSDP